MINFAVLFPALSQIMLFVDGMNGVVNHNETVQWLYTLCGSLVSYGDTNTTDTDHNTVLLTMGLGFTGACVN